MGVLGMSFTFAAVNSSTIGVYLEQGGVHAPFIAPTKDRRISIPTMDGQWDFGAYFDDMPIELDCFIVNKDRVAMMASAASLGDLLDPRAGKRPLILPDRPGYRLARYAGSIDFVPLVMSVKFKLPFIAEPISHPI
jgi:hypothetical protein